MVKFLLLFAEPNSKHYLTVGIEPPPFLENRMGACQDRKVDVEGSNIIIQKNDTVWVILILTVKVFLLKIKESPTSS